MAGGIADTDRGLCGAVLRPPSATNPASPNVAASKHTHDEGVQTRHQRARHPSRAWLPGHSRARAHPAKPWTSMAVSQRERQQRRQPGRAARRAQSMAKRRLEARTSCLSEARREGPTFRRWRALSIRGFRARFLRSIISGGLQGRLWNIHNEPLRMAASPLPSFLLQEEMGSGVFRFGAENHPARSPDGWGCGHVIHPQRGPVPPPSRHDGVPTPGSSGKDAGAWSRAGGETTF